MLTNISGEIYHLWTILMLSSYLLWVEICYLVFSTHYFSIPLETMQSKCNRKFSNICNLSYSNCSPNPVSSNMQYPWFFQPFLICYDFCFVPLLRILYWFWVESCFKAKVFFEINLLHWFSKILWNANLIMSPFYLETSSLCTQGKLKSLYFPQVFNHKL